MFREIRYQTGELQEVMADMKSGKIPCMDVTDADELHWVLTQLAQQEVYQVEEIPFDRTAKDRVKDPEFEYRIAFSNKAIRTGTKDPQDDIMYIDFYFEPEMEETYDSIGEI